ncbi:MAG: Dihydroorotase, partial [Cyanobacteriota bacterium]
ELILPCLWQQLVVTGLLTPAELWRALSIQPLNCLGLTSGASNWMVFDPDATWTAGQGKLKTPAHNSPWWGHTLSGRVVAVCC